MYSLSGLGSAAQVHVAEIGSGSGGTSMVVMAALASFADHVEFLYTDISPALVGYGRKTYGGAYPFARFQLLDVDQDVESQGCGAGTYDVVFATNVLHATANMRRTMTNCKVMLRKGEGSDCVALPSVITTFQCCSCYMVDAHQGARPLTSKHLGLAGQTEF